MIRMMSDEVIVIGPDDGRLDIKYKIYSINIATSPQIPAPGGRPCIVRSVQSWDQGSHIMIYHAYDRLTLTVSINSR